jgi:phage major head subunit gpT-like protein
MPAGNIYTPSHLDSRDLIADFYPRLEAQKEMMWAADLAAKIASDSETENYKWLGQVPVMREWIGNRQEQVLNKFSMSLTNKKYELTLPISLDDLRRDKTGQIRVRVADMARRVATWPNTLLSTLITNGEAGTSGLAYDGQFFFDTDHNESGSSQTNDLTSTEIPSANCSSADAPTATEAANILNEVAGYFMSYTDDRGEPINQDTDNITIMVGSHLYRAAFQQAISLQNLASGATNPTFGGGVGYKVIFNPRLSNTADKVYFFRTAPDMRAFILQEELPLQTQLLGAGSDEEFNNDRHVFGVKWIGAAGYGMWQNAIYVAIS